MVADRSTSYSKSHSEQWLANDAVIGLPRVQREFDNNRDPLLKAQLRDIQKTESQRRREQSKQTDKAQSKQGRGSKMVQEDQPYPAPHPTGPIANVVDQQTFNARWLAEQKTAVMAQAVKHQNSKKPGQEMARVAAVQHHQRQ